MVSTALQRYNLWKLNFPHTVLWCYHASSMWWTELNKPFWTLSARFQKNCSHSSLTAYSIHTTLKLLVDRVARAHCCSFRVCDRLFVYYCINISFKLKLLSSFLRLEISVMRLSFQLLTLLWICACTVSSFDPSDYFSGTQHRPKLGISSVNSVFLRTEK